MSQPYSVPPPYSPQSSDAYPPQQPMMNYPPPYAPQQVYYTQPPNAYPPQTIIQYVQSPPPTNAPPYIVANQPVFYSSNPVFQTTPVRSDHQFYFNIKDNSIVRNAIKWFISTI